VALFARAPQQRPHAREQFLVLNGFTINHPAPPKPSRDLHLPLRGEHQHGTDSPTAAVPRNRVAERASAS
jgi:hypothetical protein